MDTFFKNLERCRGDEGMCLLKAAKNIRQDLLGSNSIFNGDLITVLKNLLFPHAYFSYLE